MSELTQEQFAATQATEDQLVELSAEVGAIYYEGTGALTWNLASTLVGRNLDAMPVGELRTVIREACR